MANQTFGYLTAPNYGRWGGSSTYACVGLRSTMPEDGIILQLSVYLGRYADATVPIVWGEIWNRSTGAILAQSQSSISPTNTMDTYSELVKVTFAMQNVKITAGTPLWIGFARNSADANRALWFGSRTSSTGQSTDYLNASRSTPGSFAVTNTWANEALFVEVVYKTGGQVKVWNGSTFDSKPAKVFNGSSWLEKPVKIWDGSQWKESNS